MAIRYRAKSDAYQVYWNNPITGKREVKTFHTKQEAEKENSLILHRLRYEPESFSKSVSARSFMDETILADKISQPREKHTITLCDAYSIYLKSKRFSAFNQEKYSSCMRSVLRLIGTIPVNKLSVNDLIKVRDTFIKDNKITQATVHTRLVMLRAVINFTVDLGLREPIKFPKIPGSNYQKFVPPSMEELKAMFRVAPSHIQRVIIIGAYFGARIGRSELLQLTWSDVDWNKNVLRIHGSKKNTNAPWREVPIRQDLIDTFKTWYKADRDTKTAYLINYKGKPIKSIKTSWKAVLRRAGISRRIRPYDLRHSFGTELIANGADIGTVASLMGHSNPTMLLTHYQYVLDKQKEKAISMLPNVTFDVTQR